ncbi:MAG: SDR family NAD(P)-dependent oxidoreductase [Kofleriaceae bacterium]
MRHVLVTGANKGIGFAIVEAILAEHADTFVYLGSRDASRGRDAAASVARTSLDRVKAVSLDVADDASVASAVTEISGHLAGKKLYGIVNNAGLGSGTGNAAAIIDTNALGVRRVCEAFLPLLDPSAGRIVNVTSASGPLYVASCDPDTQRFLLDRHVTWPRLKAFIDERSASVKDAYGFSKACANSYTMIVAREHPGLVVNACTPGFIATDLTRHYAESAGKSPAELGMKTPAEGTRSSMHLLFGSLEGTGNYYGSDAKRSPLDRYRAPGSPEFTGP